MKKIFGILAMAAMIFSAASCGKEEGNDANIQFKLYSNGTEYADGSTVAVTVEPRQDETGVAFAIENLGDEDIKMQAKYAEVAMDGMSFVGLCTGDVCLPQTTSETFTVPAHGKYEEFHMTMSVENLEACSGECKLTFGEAQTFAGSKTVTVKFN